MPGPPPHPRLGKVTHERSATYIAKYCDGLGRFLTDGRVEIDNSTVERTIRPRDLNRKNAFLAGHDQTLVTQAINGEPCEMEFAYVLASGESFSFTVHAVYLPRPRIEIAGPQGVQATFDWQAARDATLGRMCTAQLVNDRSAY